MQMVLVARCRSVQTSCIHNQLCNICRIARLNAIAPEQRHLDMRFWSFIGTAPAPYMELHPQLLSVFPPRVIQEARLPTGPSSRLGSA